MNFTFVVKKPEDGGFGAMNKNGTWTGMIGGVQRRDYDMGKSCNLLTKCVSFLKDFFISAIAPFLITLERSKAISFSQAIGNVYHNLFIKNPADSFNLAAYTNTLKAMVWIFIGLFCLICPLILYLVTQ